MALAFGVAGLSLRKGGLSSNGLINLKCVKPNVLKSGTHYPSLWPVVAPCGSDLSCYLQLAAALSGE